MNVKVRQQACDQRHRHRDQDLYKRDDRTALGSPTYFLLLLLRPQGADLGACMSVGFASGRNRVVGFASGHGNVASGRRSSRWQRRGMGCLCNATTSTRNSQRCNGIVLVLAVVGNISRKSRWDRSIGRREVFGTESPGAPGTTREVTHRLQAIVCITAAGSSKGNFGGAGEQGRDGDAGCLHSAGGSVCGLVATTERQKCSVSRVMVCLDGRPERPWTDRRV